jgi:TRAP-type uncharacterized transport system substrate-binding protein
MIKKIALLALAATIAASSVASAATKKIKLTNEAGAGVYYKVGGVTKYLAPGSSKSFPISAKSKNVKIQASTAKSGGFRTVATLSKAEAKANPFIQINPVTGQTTDLSK